MTSEEELREHAIKAIKKKRDFWNHFIVYCVVNAFLIAIWYITGHGYFWPVWVLAGWGIGLVLNAWDAYGRSNRAIGEDEIQREIERQRRG
jgi:2TM domain